jgi:DNA polymerase III gamma/tau subunit
MLEGSTGSGKTTLAYILANAFGADKSTTDDVNCVHLSGINDMREKMENLWKTSFLGRRVLILDEIHRLSAQSQDVLLKPLEILDNVLIIACTTTIEKLGPQLLDRFKRLKVMPLSNKESLSLIERIEQGEKIEIPKWKKVLLVEKSDGIPRRLLFNIEKILKIDDEKEVSFLLDLSEYEEENSDVLDLFKSMLAMQSWPTVKDKLKKCLKSVPPEGIRIGLMNIVSARLMSDYGTDEEKFRLSFTFKELKTPLQFPEKANVTFLVYNMSGIMRKLSKADG